MTEAEVVEGVLAGWHICPECKNLVEPWDALGPRRNESSIQVVTIHEHCLAGTDKWVKWKRTVNELRERRGLPPLA